MKKAKLSVIATHSGSFHCDEALACFMLQSHTAEFKGGTILRTRDESLLSTASIVVDVGSVYDPQKLRFDHHQRGFEGTLSDKHTIKLSSAGLVYKHYGREVIQSIGGAALADNQDDLELVYQRVYTELVASVDAIDNGISQFAEVQDGSARYKVNTDLGSRVKSLNPPWNVDADDQYMNAQFRKAMAMAGEELERIVRYQTDAWLPARHYVIDMMKSRTNPQIGIFDRFVPFADHLFSLEGNEEVIYVLFPDQSGMWRVRAVPEAPGSFASRLPLPEPWRGIRGDQLQQVMGDDVPPGATFVHHAGFIGGHKTKEGAIAMASLALKNLT